MPQPAVLLILATLLPLASFGLLVFVGKRMGNPLAGWVATVAIAGSVVCSAWALIAWFNADPDLAWGVGKMPINLTFQWLPVGPGLSQQHPGFLDVGVYVDSLTILMFGMVSVIATLVHVFSIGYMAEDKRFPRFFTYLGLFCFSMLGLLLGGTILQLFVFWEMVGLCSYLLIGFWYEKKSASNAAIKAFVANRVGDFGFLIGFGILFYHLGNATLPDVWRMLDVSHMTEAGLTLANGVVISKTLLTVMGIGLFFGAVGKSAQFPLHVWLPDAMEGPTPVSALIHAATMVAAGVYLVGRIFPILTPDARLFIAIIGATTLTMAALIAIVQSDIKKVLAYSTLSQLGYMILAMGIGSWVGGLFHLITHAFFKALLFLGSGSVIYAAHHEQELPQYGGLFKKIPVTAITFGIAVLAIAGMPGLSGYYSKDLILASAGAFSILGVEKSGSQYYWLLFILPSCMAYVTAFYMTRCWMLTFAGKPRNPHVFEHAHERPIMYLPLGLLALGSIVAGYNAMGVKDLLTNTVTESNKYVRVVQGHPEFDGYSRAWPADRPDELDKTNPAAAAALPAAYKEGWEHVEKYVFWAPFAGILLGVIFYWNGYSLVNLLMKIPPLKWIHWWLYRRMLFDELYMGVFVLVLLGISKLSAAFDKFVVDGLVNLAGRVVRGTSSLAGLYDRYVIDGAVNGMATMTQELGAAVRAPQTGRIRMYVTVLLAALALGVAAAVVVAMSR